MQGFRAYFTPENRGKPEGRRSLLPGEETDFHGNGSESGSELIGAAQHMRRHKQREDNYFSPLLDPRLHRAAYQMVSHFSFLNPERQACPTVFMSAYFLQPVLVCLILNKNFQNCVRFLFGSCLYM